MHLLVSWIGTADLRAPAPRTRRHRVGCPGHRGAEFDPILLLADQEPAKLRLRKMAAGPRLLEAEVPLKIKRVEPTRPTNFIEIYSAATGALDAYLKELDDRLELTFHLSPGRLPRPRSG
jgi:hypothetical protein